MTSLDKTLVRKMFEDRMAADSRPWLKDHILFATLHGSHAYGTNTPTSDIDIKGFAVAPLSNYIGLDGDFAQAEFKGKEPDGVIYEIRKFFRLALECNPSIIEVLFTDQSDWVTCHPAARRILEERQIFVSKKAFKTFFGYADGQLKRINNHYRWLTNPPSHLPTRKECGLPERPVVPPDQMGAALSQIQKRMEEWDINWDLLEPADRIEMESRLQEMLATWSLSMEQRWLPTARSMGFDENYIQMIQAEKAYQTKVKDWQSYQRWQAERNPDRSELEAKFGYDTKHGMHLERLILMCEEMGETGQVIVKRPDAEYLLGIRNGNMPYPTLVERAKNARERIARIYSTSKAIPKEPDYARAEELCQATIREFLKF